MCYRLCREKAMKWHLLRQTQFLLPFIYCRKFSVLNCLYSTHFDNQNQREKIKGSKKKNKQAFPAKTRASVKND